MYFPANYSTNRTLCPGIAIIMSIIIRPVIIRFMVT